MGGEVRLWLFFLTTVFDPKKVLELFPHQFGTFLNPWKNCPSYRSIHFRKKRKKIFFHWKWICFGVLIPKWWIWELTYLRIQKFGIVFDDNSLSPYGWFEKSLVVCFHHWNTSDQLWGELKSSVSSQRITLWAPLMLKKITV